jgi:hypothetical protein
MHGLNQVSNIEGDAADNRELKEQMEKVSVPHALSTGVTCCSHRSTLLRHCEQEAAERAAKAAQDEAAGKSKDAELESDEE